MGGSGLSQKAFGACDALRHPRRNAYHREAGAAGEDRCVACAGAYSAGHGLVGAEALWGEDHFRHPRAGRRRVC